MSYTGYYGGRSPVGHASSQNAQNAPTSAPAPVQDVHNGAFPQGEVQVVRVRPQEIVPLISQQTLHRALNANQVRVSR